MLAEPPESTEQIGRLAFDLLRDRLPRGWDLNPRELSDSRQTSACNSWHRTAKQDFS